MLIYAFDEVVCRNIITFVKLTKIDQFKKATLFKSKNKNIFNIFLNKFQRFNNCLFFVFKIREHTHIKKELYRIIIFFNI